jgi:hypothetical protein
VVADPVAQFAVASRGAELLDPRVLVERNSLAGELPAEAAP